MNKKVERKNDLRSSILLLILLLLVLTSSTYAWFTANETVTISSLDVTIEAQNGLQISTDATNWKAIITNTDITENAYTGNANYVPQTMEPVSTVGEIDSETGFMKMYYGTVGVDDDDATGTYKLTATQTADSAGKYIAFDMFLKVDATTQLKLTEASSVVMEAKSSDKGIKQASRVAFCVQGSEEAGTATNNITALKGATSFGEEASTVYIWEPNANLHTDAAVSHAYDTYRITTTSDGKADPVEYYGINDTISEGVALINTNNGNDDSFTQITPNYVTNADTDGTIEAEEEIFTLDAGITKVRVYMWIEGQDVDCENTASGTDISFNLQFEVVKEPAKVEEGEGA